MPIQSKSENGKCYEIWGSNGAKYYYKCGDEVAREEAKKKAIAQANAVHANPNEYSSNNKLINFINFCKHDNFRIK